MTHALLGAPSLSETFTTRSCLQYSQLLLRTRYERLYRSGDIICVFVRDCVRSEAERHEFDTDTQRDVQSVTAFTWTPGCGHGRER
jgi:hypothetical protein